MSTFAATKSLTITTINWRKLWPYKSPLSRTQNQLQFSLTITTITLYIHWLLRQPTQLIKTKYHTYLIRPKQKTIKDLTCGMVQKLKSHHKNLILYVTKESVTKQVQSWKLDFGYKSSTKPKYISLFVFIFQVSNSKTSENF